MGENQSAAVLFADIAASTQLRSELGDSEADALLDPLLATLSRVVEKNRGQVIKSDGDDVVAVFELSDSCVDDAAQAAIDCQLAARDAGRRLYVGLDAGPVEFREVFGRPDLSGMAVNIAARLHKLVPDLPGQIFLGPNTVKSLSDLLRKRARPYGVRSIKGVGEMEVHSLDWDEAVTVLPTRFSVPQDKPEPTTVLGLAYNGQALRLVPNAPPFQVGRHRSNDVQVDDDQQRVSSRHMQIFNRHGVWVLKDTSRNGTWIQFRRGGEVSVFGDEVTLVSNGRLCLGRSFGEDAEGRFTIAFQLVET